MLQLAISEIFVVKWLKFMPKIWHLGVPLGALPPKGETLCPGQICTIVQNFKPIGATVDEIYITGNS